MKKLIAALIALGFLMVIALPAVAAWDAEDVAEIKKKLQEGKGFFEGGSYNSDDVQIIRFNIEGGSTFWIDFKAKLCMFFGRQAITPVPCSSIKKGYPLFAPLIIWED